MGVVNFLTAMSLLIGQSEDFFELLRDWRRCRQGQMRVPLICLSGFFGRGRDKDRAASILFL
jgi:hypothetical protein